MRFPVVPALFVPAPFVPAVFVLASLSVWLPATVSAQPDALPEGCFCVRHLATDDVARDCEAFHPAASFFPRALCTNDRGERVSLPMDDRRVVVPALDDRCRPCDGTAPSFFWYWLGGPILRGADDTTPADAADVEDIGEDAQ